MGSFFLDITTPRSKRGTSWFYWSTFEAPVKRNADKTKQFLITARGIFATPFIKSNFYGFGPNQYINIRLMTVVSAASIFISLKFSYEVILINRWLQTYNSLNYLAQTENISCSISYYNRGARSVLVIVVGSRLICTS